jgi:4-hydroxybenzoate polyprenyltransferase
MAWINWLAYGNILIAFSAGIVTYGFAQSVDVPEARTMGVTVFFATLFVYGLQRLLRLPDLSATNNPRHDWLLKNKSRIQLVSGLSGLVAALIFTVWLLEIWSFVVLTIIAVISVLYAWRMGRFTPLREWPYLKIILIAGSWTSVCFLWPLIAGQEITAHQFKLLIAPFLYFTALIIPFDVRDLNYDHPNQQTVPQLLGAKNAVYVALFLLVSSYAFGYLLDDAYAAPMMILAYAAQFVLILFSFQPRSEYFYAFGIDGAIVLFGWAYVF